VDQGETAIRRAFNQLRDGGRRYAITDAVTDAHLHAIGAACADHALITGGSGIAMGLPQNFRNQGLLPDRGDADTLPEAAKGAMAVVVGSCSRATLGQIGLARDHVPVLELDALATPGCRGADPAGAGMDGRQALRGPPHRHRRQRPAGQGGGVAAEAGARRRRYAGGAHHGHHRR
jgi:hypothetical protein